MAARRVADGSLAWERSLAAGPLSSSPTPRLAQPNAKAESLGGSGGAESCSLWIVSNSGACFYLSYPDGGDQRSATTETGKAKAKASDEDQTTTTSAPTSSYSVDPSGSVSIGEEAPFTEAAVQLPEGSFTSPVALGDWVFLGCRDNYLYCLGLV